MARGSSTRAAQAPKPTIAVVEHVAMWRRGLVSVLDEPGCYTVQGLRTGAELLALCAKGTAPHLALLELDLPEMDGYVLLALLSAQAPGVRTIAMGYRPDDASIRKALRLGAGSVLCTTMPEEALLKAARDVLLTEHHHNALVQRVLVTPQTKGVATTPDRFAELSAQELRYVKEQCASGCPGIATIAERMKIKLNTAKTYRHRAMQKLKVKGVPALVQLAFLHGLLHAGKG